MPCILVLAGGAIMSCFKNILVGLDLTKYQRLDPEELHQPARDAVADAIGLARRARARLLFFAAMNMPEEALHHLEEDARTHLASTVEEKAAALLMYFVEQARQEGVAAAYKITLGPGWLDITKQVVHGGHDLVIVGTSELTPLRRILFGDTARKLLRRCPCPVWVSKPGHLKQHLNILVATDLTPASLGALQVGLGLGRLLDGNVHALHVVEYPLDYLWGPDTGDVETAAYHRKIRDEAAEKMHLQLRQAAGPGPTGVMLHLAERVGTPDEAIQHYIDEHKIDLLIMGTVARSGMQGIFIGNTPERLVAQVQCSLLAVKPPEFRGPVPSSQP
jgi:universal stress protein E